MREQESRRRPPLRLPFMGKQKDIGEWTYDNRVGLLTSLIIYILLAIGFVFGRIYILQQPHTQGVYIDLSEIEQVEQIRDELLKEVKERQFDWGEVSNRVSNENSLDERVRDDRGSNVEELNSSAQNMQQRLEANREAYEKELSAIEQMRHNTNNSNSQSDSQSKDAKIEGSVTVSYSFMNPVRHSETLIVPAYQCQGGGEVVIEATLNNRGVVTSAKVVRGGDDCMQRAALAAARSSRFSSDNSAPQSHIGTITYIYIPQ